MVGLSLRDCRILLVEDEYLLADDLTHVLEQSGAVVLGPVPSVDGALAMIDTEPRIDAAVLDVNLQGAMSFPVADALLARGVPFTFATGYDPWMFPARFAALPRLEKPFRPERLAEKLGPLLSSG